MASRSPVSFRARGHLLLGAVIGLSCLFASLCKADEPNRLNRPNFLVILVDDLGWKDLGCYGSSFYETPHIDRLAQGGIRFTDGYASCPVCSPTRVSVQTGLNPTRLHTTEWFGGPQPEQILKGHQRKRFKNRPLLPASYREELPLQEETLAEVLAEQGYETFFAGKWHLGGQGFYPEQQGYHINVGGHEKGSPPGGYFSPYNNPKLSDGPKQEHLPARLANEAVSFLSESTDQPFLLMLSFYSVHTPLQGKPDLIQKYQAKAASLGDTGPKFLPEGRNMNRQVQDHAVYAAMVEAMDSAVGNVLDELRRLELEQNTVVVFTSDNGGLSTAEGSPTSNLPLRGGKGWIYEGGIRVPWIIRWPNVTPAGKVSDQPIVSHDLMPTFREIARVQEQAPSPLDGISLLDLMKGQGSTESRDLYWHYPHYSNQGGPPAAAIRSGRWKLVERYEDHSLELYDLSQDLGETENLADSRAKKATELHARLLDWRRRLSAQMQAPNPAFEEATR